MYTLEELKEWLIYNIDVVTLVEDLGISSKRLVELLHDVVDEQYDSLTDLYDLNKDENESS